MAITLARKVLFGRIFIFILGLFDLLKPLSQVSHSSEVVCRCFNFGEVLGATRAKSVWELHWELCSQWMWNEGHSWMFSAFWIHLYNLFFFLRHASHCLASGKLSGPLGPFQWLRCAGLGSSVWGETKAYFCCKEPYESNEGVFRIIWRLLKAEMLKISFRQLRAIQGRRPRLGMQCSFWANDQSIFDVWCVLEIVDEVSLIVK